jgi:transposase
MAHNLLVPKRDQRFLLPPSMAEWLPEDHLAWFVLDAVEEMDLSAFYADYRADGWGGAAHDPAAMVALLLYAYCVGVRSSRQIERSCQADIAFRVICGGLFPDHSTIARFRARHEEALKRVFSATLRLCEKAGMATVGLVALDGTKMAAAASLQRNATIESLERQVDQMFAEAHALDEADNARFSERRGDEPPAALRGRTERRKRFARAKELLDHELDDERTRHEAHLAWRAEEEARQGKKLRGRKPKAPHDKARHKTRKLNTTDPESKVMTHATGVVQGYNAQAVVNEAQVIVSAEVTNEQNDRNQLHPMIAATSQSLGAAGIVGGPGVLLADCGYASEENFTALTEGDPNCYVATRNMERTTLPRPERPGPKRDLPALDAMDLKVSAAPGRALYAKRSQLVEPVFGQIKGARGIRSFMRRGKAAAESEWKLICATHNLLKLYRRSLASA